MNPPICKYEVLSQDWKDAHGKARWDAIATPVNCGHLGHHYLEFQQRLTRFNEKLHLGFDLKNGYWIIYLWEPETERLEKGLNYVHRYLKKILTLKWVVSTRGPEGNKVYRSYFREPGEWVLGHLQSYSRDQMNGGTAWYDKEQKAIATAAEETARTERRKKVEDAVADALTLADRGDPTKIRKSVRVTKTLAEATA